MFQVYNVPSTHLGLFCHSQVDPFHTLFGICGLSLLGYKGLKSVNPVYCMPEDVIERLGIKLNLL